MRPSLLLLVPLLALPATLPDAAPCVRPTRAGTAVQGDVKICPGRYRIPDPDARGVIVVGSANTRLDLTSVTLVSPDSLAHEFTGIGVHVAHVDGVTILNGRISGYRYGILIEGGRDHRVLHTDVSGSRAQALRSTPTTYDEGDWLDIFRPDTFAQYGSGIQLRRTVGAEVRGVTAREAQNGIGLFEARGSHIVDNDVSHNSGWGIHLWRSAQNVIVRNQAHHNVRCESEHYRRGCDSAGILLREQSDSNVIADNDISHSGDGFFLSGHRPYVQPSIGNVVLRNDASHSWHNAFESTFSHGNTFIDNRADSSDYGFWLGYSSGTVVQGNTILGTRSAAIAIEHGADNTITGNVIVGGAMGIRLFAPRPDGPPSRDARVDDNVLARLSQALVLERTTRLRGSGNLFDGVGEAVVADAGSSDARLRGNVFLRVTAAFVRADALDLGDNFWAADSAEVRARSTGRVVLEPFRRAREAGY